MISARGGGKDISAQATGSNVSALEIALKTSTEYACKKLGIVPTRTAQVEKKVSDEENRGSNLDLEKLNAHLANTSYVTGYELSVNDVTVFKACSKGEFPEHVHVQRWYRHVESFGDKLERLKGKMTNLGALGLATKGQQGCGEQKDEEEDDFDVFGEESDEEEANKLKEVNWRKISLFSKYTPM